MNEQQNLTAEQQGDIQFDNRINLLGRVTSIISLLLMFAVPTVITIASDVQLNFSEVIANSVGLIAAMAPTAIVENISYYTILGAGGIYLSCITGNIMNMKLPAAIAGMNIAGVEPGSKKGAVISIIAIGISSITTAAILFLGMLLIGEFLMPLLSNPVLQPGFDNIMPSLMGAMAVPFILQNKKLSIVPLAVSLVLCIAMGPAGVQSMRSYLLPVVMIISAVSAWLMFKRGFLDKKPESKEKENVE